MVGGSIRVYVCMLGWEECCTGRRLVGRRLCDGLAWDVYSHGRKEASSIGDTEKLCSGSCIKKK